MKSQLPSHQTGIQNSSANVNVQVRPNILLKALETATTKGELISECIYDALLRCLQCTLRPSGTLLLSGLPKMI